MNLPPPAGQATGSVCLRFSPRCSKARSSSKAPSDASTCQAVQQAPRVLPELRPSTPAQHCLSHRSDATIRLPIETSCASLKGGDRCGYGPHVLTSLEKTRAGLHADERRHRALVGSLRLTRLDGKETTPRRSSSNAFGATRVGLRDTPRLADAAPRGSAEEADVAGTSPARSTLRMGAGRPTPALPVLDVGAKIAVTMRRTPDSERAGSEYRHEHWATRETDHIGNLRTSVDKTCAAQRGDDTRLRAVVGRLRRKTDVSLTCLDGRERTPKQAVERIFREPSSGRSGTCCEADVNMEFSDAHLGQEIGRRGTSKVEIAEHDIAKESTLMSPERDGHIHGFADTPSATSQPCVKCQFGNCKAFASSYDSNTKEESPQSKAITIFSDSNIDAESLQSTAIATSSDSNDDAESPQITAIESSENSIDEESPKYHFLPHPVLASSAEFSVVSMNILAGCLARPHIHTHCKAEHLAWENRRAKLLSGFSRVRPDLLCLQEVQGTAKPCANNHVEDLCNELSVLGYRRAAYARLACADGHELGVKKKKEPHVGNAILFIVDKWEYVESGRIAFAEVLTKQCASSMAQVKHYAEGKQVVAWTRLKHVATGQLLIVACTHIACNYRQADTQVAQVDAMLRHLATEVVRDGEPVLVCGDFNSLPASGVYRLMSTGKLLADHPDAMPKNTEIPPICDRLGFQSNLRFSSAYKTLLGSEPAFTTCGPGFSGTLDYIWYTPESLVPVPGTALGTPSLHDVVVEDDGLPNAEIPSDHVPIGAAFRFAAVCPAPSS